MKEFLVGAIAGYMLCKLMSNKETRNKVSDKLSDLKDEVTETINQGNINVGGGVEVPSGNSASANEYHDFSFGRRRFRPRRRFTPFWAHTFPTIGNMRQPRPQAATYKMPCEKGGVRKVGTGSTIESAKADCARKLKQAAS